MQGDQVPAITEQFAEFARQEKLFERVQQGAKYVFPSNHLALPDQGFTLGYFHKAAHRARTSTGSRTTSRSCSGGCSATTRSAA